jgi:hypothetical protein
MYQPERRKWVRHEVGLGTTLAPVDGRGPAGSATIRNISTGGVYLSALLEIKPGTMIYLLLKTAVTARVLRVSLETAGPPCRWTLNCEFVNPLMNLEELLPSYCWLGCRSGDWQWIPINFADLG